MEQIRVLCSIGLHIVQGELQTQAMYGEEQQYIWLKCTCNAVAAAMTVYEANEGSLQCYYTTYNVIK